MKISLFAQAPYRYLPEDFEQNNESVCSVPYSLTTREGVYSSIRDFLDELMFGARSGFDAVAVTEHGQSSYDMVPNPDLVASALAYMTEAEGIDVGIFPMGRSLGKSREPLRAAEEYAMIDVMSGGRLVPGLVVGLSYDSSINNGVPPIEVRKRFDENLELVLRAWKEPTPFAWNGKYSQYPMVNMWPRPLQSDLPTWITGIGNPIFERFWEIADQVGVPRNPYRLGFLQTIAVSETDERAEQEYGEHLEYAFRKGLGSIPMEKLALPGNIDIRGVQALLKDPGDFGLYSAMKTSTYRDLVEAGVVVA